MPLISSICSYASGALFSIGAGSGDLGLGSLVLVASVGGTGLEPSPVVLTASCGVPTFPGGVSDGSGVTGVGTGRVLIDRTQQCCRRRSSCQVTTLPIAAPMSKGDQKLIPLPSLEMCTPYEIKPDFPPADKVCQLVRALQGQCDHPRL